jgi:hypothetical protein
MVRLREPERKPDVASSSPFCCLNNKQPACYQAASRPKFALMHVNAAQHSMFERSKQLGDDIDSTARFPAHPECTAGQNPDCQYYAFAMF